MKIVADENIPLLADALEPIGSVVAVAADRITPALVRDADALLVRSVTPVGPALLDGSAVRFVGTATIGTDHVDRAYLARRRIGFASAEGSNARSVAEYVFAALAALAEPGGWRFEEKTLGIVGVGNIGSRVARIAEGLGMNVLRNDPPLARRSGDPQYVPIEVLAEADIVTFHVPLARGGSDPTYHMINQDLMEHLKQGVILLNTSRGTVHDTAALKAASFAGRLGALVLDVWENEPAIDLELLHAADLATPHIAGYSYDGKVNGTRMILEALCRHFGLTRQWDPSAKMPPPETPRVAIRMSARVEGAIRLATRAAYDIEADDARLRRIAQEPPDCRAAYFQGLRKHYSIRREFPLTTACMESDNPPAAKALAALGFPVERHRPKEHP